MPFVTTKTDFPFQHVSYELAQLSIDLSYKTFHLLCLYRPPPSTKNCLNDSQFIDEISDLFAYCNTLKGSYIICGDFNFHFDVPSNAYTSKLIDQLDTFGLTQCVLVHTHKRGHTLDWIIHRSDQPIVSSVITDQTLPSDHFCLLSQIHLRRPPPSKVQVQARNLAGVDMPTFETDLSSSLNVSHPSTADELNHILSDILDQHAPASTRSVSRRPASPWFSAVGPQLLEAKRNRRRAERQWIKTGLTVHKQIFQAANKAVTEIVHSAKTAFYNEKILAATTSKQLYNITNSLLGKHESSSLPKSIHPSRLSQAFSDSFDSKIETLRQGLDNCTASVGLSYEQPFSGLPLTALEPVTEATIRSLVKQS